MSFFCLFFRSRSLTIFTGWCGRMITALVPSCGCCPFLPHLLLHLISSIFLKVIGRMEENLTADSFVNLLSSLSTPDNQVRAAAEQQYEALKEQPDGFLAFSLLAVSECEDEVCNLLLLLHLVGLPVKPGISLYTDTHLCLCLCVSLSVSLSVSVSSRRPSTPRHPPTSASCPLCCCAASSSRTRTAPTPS